METTKEKTSYCIGYESGKNLKHQFTDVETKLMIAGFQDAVLDNFSQLSEKEMQTILTNLRQQIELQQRQYIAGLAEKNKKAGETFLQGNKQKTGVVSLPSGLQYKVLKQGKGSSPTLFDTVNIHYQGRFIDGNVFDSSYERNQPQLLPVNRLIPGWSEALQLMVPGDKWELYVPSYLAYGEQGFSPHIPPNSTLLFEVELLAVNPGT